MKKLFMTVGFVAICAINLLAQGLGLGIKGGINIANQNVSGLGDPETSSEIGFHGGVFVTFMFSEKLGIQPEILYSSQGSTIEFGSQEYIENLGYITLPVLLRYNINDMFSLHAGPQFGLLISAEGEDYLGDTYDSMDSFKKSDIGLGFGAEADLPIKLGIGARYVLGLTDIVSDEDGESWDGYEFKNGTFQIYAKFRLMGD